jgi:predicted CXXCH cytochrome family protein
MISLLSISCSKQNAALVPGATGGYQEQMATYPHPTTWKNQHMDFMASGKDREVSCLQCHKSNLGAPLKVSCAMTCHQNPTVGMPPKETPIPAPNKCTECHSEITDNKYAHYPANAGLCTSCHTVSDKHLEGEGDKPETKTTANDCYRCHTRQDTGKTVHGALEDENSCIQCHNPHGGNQRFFIKEKSIQSLCLNCHDVAVDTKVKHGPSVDQKSCLNCHSPHSSNNAKLLKLPSQALCLSCHDKTIPATLSDVRTIPNIKAKIENTSSQHTGATMGDCTTCHKPHGSENNRLLTENYSISNYNAYPGTGKDPYALCFTCHDSGMLKPDDTTTGFRDGKTQKNSHWSHVVDAGGGQNKSKGRSCRICHDPHGSNQDFNINDSWQMNGHAVKIKYTKTEKGGGCTYTCHGLKTYERE